MTLDVDEPLALLVVHILECEFQEGYEEMLETDDLLTEVINLIVAQTGSDMLKKLIAIAVFRR